MHWKHRRWAVTTALGCLLAAGSATSFAQVVRPDKSATSSPVMTGVAARVSEPVPVPRGTSNDECSTPDAISGSGPFVFDNRRATTGREGQENHGCANEGPPGILYDEWFCWTADCTGTVTISTCGQTQVNTKIALWDGCNCPRDGEEPLCCADDQCDRQTQLRCEVRCGQRYMIQIGLSPNGGSPGSGTFTIQCDGEPCGGNDECPMPQCCGAKPIYTDQAYSTFTGQVMAQVAETFYPPANSTMALTIFDIKNANTAPLDVNWNPANFRYSNPAWTKVNMGSLFGITLDDRGNIYTSHTTIYNGGHFLQEDQAEQLSQVVINFCSRLPK